MSEENENQEGGEGAGPSPEVITRAKSLGWAEKDKFRGAADAWVDADEFVRRGEEVLPIVKAQNRRLEETVSQQASQIERLNATLTETNESLGALREFNTKQARERAKSSLRDVRVRIEEARTAGETESVVNLREQETELESALEEAGEQPAAKVVKTDTTPQQNGGLTPEQATTLKNWAEATGWFGKDDAESKNKTRYAQGLANELTQAEPTLKGQAFLDRVQEETEKAFPNRAANKAEGGSSNGTRTTASANGTPRGKTYERLSAEEKAACDADEKRLVGPNKAFKTQAEWRKYYVENVE